MEEKSEYITILNFTDGECIISKVDNKKLHACEDDYEEYIEEQFNLKSSSVLYMITEELKLRFKDFE